MTTRQALGAAAFAAALTAATVRGIPARVLPTEVLDWATPARRLTGHSDVARKEAIERIRRMPGIERSLLGELSGERKHLALDVIVALELDRMVPALLAAAEKDRDGAVYLAIGALLTDDSEALVTEAFIRRLREVALPAPAQVVMLDTLARLDAPLTEKDLLRLLAGPSPEVRSAVVYFARLKMLSDRSPAYVGVLGAAIESRPYQVRLQALHAVRELKDLLGPGMAVLLKPCVDDSVAVVRALCRELRQGKS